MKVSKDRTWNKQEGIKIARHQKLEDNQFKLLRKIFASQYPLEVSGAKVDFTSPGTYFKALNSGRLSFVFLAQQGENQVFLKIVKPGFVRDNIPFAVLCTEECRLHSSIPTFKTFRGKNGELYQSVPDSISGDQTELNFFAGQTITLTEAAPNGINEIPEALSEIPGGRKGQLALMEQLGAYIVKVSRAASAVTDDLPKGIVTDDPTGFITGRKVAAENFALSASLTYLRGQDDRKELKECIKRLLPNLENSPEACSFYEGLKRGDLEIILDYFNDLEKNIQQSILLNPATDVPVHNEIKPANVGAIYDDASNRWEITQIFDFDNIGFGTQANGDKTPLEKDLGRTLSFFAFDPVSGEFFVENAKATIKGYLERLDKKMSEAEILRLQNYIRLGIVTSYLWRSSYIAEELQGQSTGIQLARIDPGIHVTQIRRFDSWINSNSFSEMLEDLQSTPRMDRHRELEGEHLKFRNSPEYYVKRDERGLREYHILLDAAHDQINCTT